jgi:hypothetical protein
VRLLCCLVAVLTVLRVPVACLIEEPSLEPLQVRAEAPMLATVAVAVVVAVVGMAALALAVVAKRHPSHPLT